MPTFLVVEDDLNARQFLSQVLPAFGVHVHMACDCDEAERSLRENPKISAVVMDRHLPGKDGVETLRVLRGIVPGLPAIFVTGDTDAMPEVEGLVGILAKPFGVMQLRKLVEAATRMPGRKTDGSPHS
jgi:DNA-binding response OmpR family regulator